MNRRLHGNPPVGGPEIRIVRSWAGVAEVETDWRALHQASGGRLFSSFDWLAAQYEAFELKGGLQVVTLWDGSQMIAAAPLCLRRGQVSKALPFYRPEILNAWACAYTGDFEFLARNGSAMTALLDAVADCAEGRLIELDRLGPATGASATSELLRQGHSLWQDRDVDCATVVIASNWDGYLASRRRSFRKKVRRAGKAMEEAGARLCLFDGGEAQGLERMFELSSRSWKHRAGTGIAASPEARAFAAELWTRFSARKEAMILMLEAGGSDVACLMALKCQDIWYGLVTDFDEAHADLSPGRMIICNWMQTMHETHGAARFDFLRRTHFLEEFETGGYEVQRLRAAPAASMPYAVLMLDQSLRRLTSTVRLSGRKKQRRAEVIAGEPR